MKLVAPKSQDCIILSTVSTDLSLPCWTEPRLKLETGYKLCILRHHNTMCLAGLAQHLLEVGFKMLLSYDC